MHEKFLFSCATSGGNPLNNLYPLPLALPYPPFYSVHYYPFDLEKADSSLWNGLPCLHTMTHPEQHLLLIFKIKRVREGGT